MAAMATDRQPEQERIIQDPAIMVGKPVIKGTRIPVERVIAHLAHNPELGDLLSSYPELTVEDVKASLRFALAALATKRPRARSSPTTDAPATPR